MAGRIVVFAGVRGGRGLCCGEWDMRSVFCRDTRKWGGWNRRGGGRGGVVRRFEHVR